MNTDGHGLFYGTRMNTDGRGLFYGTRMNTDGRGSFYGTRRNTDGRGNFMGRGGTRMRYEHTKTLRIMQMSKNITQSANERE